MLLHLFQASNIIATTSKCCNERADLAYVWLPCKWFLIDEFIEAISLEMILFFFVLAYMHEIGKKKEGTPKKKALPSLVN